MRAFRRLCCLVFSLFPIVGCAAQETLRPFSSDGCSLFPDRALIGAADWCECCLAHDLAYWRGGTSEERLQADERLKQCVLKATGNQVLADTMFAGVRTGGSPYLYTWFRWGYGWPYERKYGPLTPEEAALASRLEREYLASARSTCVRKAPAPGKAASGSCAAPLDPSIPNSCVVSEGALWRGARPDAAGAAALVRGGVRTVVNLELLLDDREEFEKARVSVEGTREIRYFRLRDWEPNVVLAPRKLDDDVAHFIAITRTQPKPIFVHCRSGQNRTGVMVAAYRVFNGGDIEEAVAEMGRYGGIWFKHDAEYIRGLTPQRRAELERRIEERTSRLRPDARILCADAACKAVSSR